VPQLPGFIEANREKEHEETLGGGGRDGEEGDLPGRVLNVASSTEAQSLSDRSANAKLGVERHSDSNKGRGEQRASGAAAVEGKGDHGKV
jgi:hypothetical protein